VRGDEAKIRVGLFTASIPDATKALPRRKKCAGSGPFMSRLCTVKGFMLNIFFKAYAINSVLSVHALMVLNFLACQVQEKD
jgi:hypothetical protein